MVGGPKHFNLRVLRDEICAMRSAHHAP